MINFDFAKYCSGCSACHDICPVNAIAMNFDAEGFIMPEVSREKCINCGKCDLVCPHLNREKISGNRKDIKGVWLYSSDDDDAKMKSSSGAACYELAKRFLEEGGFISGCVWDENFNAKHETGRSHELLTRTQGSKYLQSDTRDIHREILELLRNGQKVLFSGTPCQANAIHNIIMNEDETLRENLITVALICHGVASPLAWESFMELMTQREKSPLISVNFRDKSQEGYKKSYCRYSFANGSSVNLPSYLPSFLPNRPYRYIEATLVYNLAMRKSCSHCDCKGINRGIDLIAGDWYAEYTGKGRLGTSCVIAFTERGRNFAQEALKDLREFEYDEILRKNELLEKSINLPPNRELFLERIKDCSYWEKVEELYPPKYKLKKLLVRFGLYSIVKKLIG